MRVDTGLIIILSGGFITLGLVVLNIVIALKNDGTESFAVTMVVHVMGLVLVVANVVRLWEVATNTTIIGNGIAFIFILVSMRRVVLHRRGEKAHDDKDQAGI